MAPLYKIALVQFEPEPLLVEANFAYAAQAIAEAAAAGAQLAVLPEYHLTSWVPEEAGFAAACAASGAYLPRYQALAREHCICIVPGTLVEAHWKGGTVPEAAALATQPEAAPEAPILATQPEAAPEAPTLVTQLDGCAVELRNMTYFIAAGTGEVLGQYQKMNLWHPERETLAAVASTPAATAGPGWSPHRAFDTPWTWGHADADRPDRPLRAGLLVCWDVAFPEAFRALVADGADLIIVPSFWTHDDDGLDPELRRYNSESELLFLRSTLVARAFENTCAVAFCNAGGVSMLAQPIVGSGTGGEVAPHEQRTLLVDLDVDLLRVAEKCYRVRADMGRADWHYGHTRWPSN